MAVVEGFNKSQVYGLVHCRDELVVRWQLVKAGSTVFGWDFASRRHEIENSL